MTKNIILTGITLAVFSLCLQSQDMRWIDMMQDPNAKFEETVAAFDEWWGDREITKGSGWKPFQRWKYYMESRLSPDGRQSGPQNTLREFTRYYESNIANKNQLAGDPEWIEQGPVNLPSNGTGQPTGVGRLTCLSFHPNLTNVLFAGSPAGGFLKSTDYGITWTNLSNNLTRLGVSSIVVHPTNTDTIYIGTGDRDGGDAPGYGVWRSIDGGQTWNSRNSGMGNRTVYEIIMDPINSDILIAATNSRIYRSTNAGLNWTQVFTGSSNKDIAFHPTDSNFIYATGKNMYRSSDNGQTWTQITNGAPANVSRIAIAVSIDAPDNVYLFSGNGSGFEGFYKSTDKGISFTQQSSSPNICGYDTNGGSGNQSWYDMVALGDPLDSDHILVGAINLWETFDGGVTWSIVSHWYGAGGNPSVHADQHVLERSPFTSDIFVGNDGGLYYTVNDGVSFTELSDGLGIAQIYRIGQSAQESNLVIAGFQDNGTAILDNGSWRTEIGGDGFECIIDYKDSDYIYGAIYYGDIRRSTNRGISFSQIAGNNINGINESGAWLTPYKLDPINPDTMFVGFKNVWRSYNCKSASSNALTWTKISTFATSSNIIDLAIAPSNTNIMYVSRSGSLEFFRCDDIHVANPTWIDLTNNLPASGDPRDIEIHPTNSSILWIALGNNIYKSTDAGLSWTDISNTLPNISLNAIVYDPSSTADALYVAMDVGVYYIDNNLTNWEPFLLDLPNTEVLELEIYIDAECISKNKVVAATYGRGLWSSPLYFDSNSMASVCFSATQTEVCTEQTVGLVDQTAHNPTSWTWTITPATFSFKNGTNQNSQNPEISFNALGFYTVELSASNVAGSDILTKIDFINVSTTAIGLPFLDDLESNSSCGTSSNCATTICALSNGWKNLTNGIDDNIDWRIDSGGTPSSSTGPNVDSNPGNNTGFYAYTEASSCFNNRAEMISPCLDFSNVSTGKFSFDYHMYGTHIGSLHLDALVDGVWQEDIIPPLIGDKGNQWFNQSVTLTNYNNKIIRFKFRAITGSSYKSDISIDNIKVTDESNCMVLNSNDSGNGSFRDCFGSVPGTTIVFDSGLQNSTIVLTSGKIIISTDLNISANILDNITISAGSSDRVFSINASIDASIEGLKLISGTSLDGRGILNNGILLLKDVEIFENASPPGSGYLLTNNGTLNIEGNCQLKN